MLRPAPKSTSQQPTSMARLVRLLGVQRASAQEQQTVLAEWLERNTPTAELKLSMRANGYGVLLPRPRRLLPHAS
jgi:hypothetical protein